MHQFKDIFSLMSMEAQNSDDWEYDHNTTVLLIIQSNLAALLKAAMLVTQNFEKPEYLDLTGMITGLTDMLEWIQDNTEKVKK